MDEPTAPPPPSFAARTWLFAKTYWKAIVSVALFFVVAIVVVKMQCSAKLEREAAVLQGRAAAEAEEAARRKLAADKATEEYERARLEVVKTKAEADAARKAAEEAAKADDAEIERIGESESVDDLP